MTREKAWLSVIPKIKANRITLDTTIILNICILQKNSKILNEIVLNQDFVVWRDIILQIRLLAAGHWLLATDVLLFARSKKREARSKQS
jgi:hypothetical protein